MSQKCIIFVAHKGKIIFDLSKSFGLTILLDNRMVNPFFLYIPQKATAILPYN